MFRKVLPLLWLILHCCGMCCSVLADEYQLPAEIFAQTDSYMAVQTQENHPISFFLISPNSDVFDGRQVERLYLDGIQGIEIISVRLEDAPNCGEYSAYSMIASASFHESGRYEFSKIRIQFSDGTSDTYSIGRFVINVYQELGSSALYTYATTAMSSNQNQLHCRYEKEVPAVQFHSLEMDLDAKYTLAVNDYECDADEAISVDVTFFSERPVVYRFVLPRIHITVNNVETVVYPKVGCYCGGLGITSEEIIGAYIAWNSSEE